MRVPWLTEAHVYAVWAAVGPLVGVLIGAWLAAYWQRKKWILENKTIEYRSILDALSSYRFHLTEYYALYEIGLVAVPAQKAYDDKVALAKSLESVTNAFADRIFTRLAIAQSGARTDWSVFAKKLLSAKTLGLDECIKMIDGVQDKLVKASQADLKMLKAG